MFRIRRFGVIRTANVVAFLYLIIIAIIFVPIAALVAALAPNAGLASGAGGVAVLFFGLVIAVFYAVVGWIFTALACVLYNFAAGMVGGIEIQLEAVEPPPPPQVWGGQTVAVPPAAAQGPTPPDASPPAPPPL
jgi:hypothetical protein